jgi:hypothetical protein
MKKSAENIGNLQDLYQWTQLMKGSYRKQSILHAMCPCINPAISIQEKLHKKYTD